MGLKARKVESICSDPDMANIEKGLERIERFCQGFGEIGCRADMRAAGG